VPPDRDACGRLFLLRVAGAQWKLGGLASMLWPRFTHGWALLVSSAAWQLYLAACLEGSVCRIGLGPLVAAPSGLFLCGGFVCMGARCFGRVLTHFAALGCSLCCIEKTSILHALRMRASLRSTSLQALACSHVCSSGRGVCAHKHDFSPGRFLLGAACTRPPHVSACCVLCFVGAWDRVLQSVRRQL
jgi:hypothetical protein